MTRKTNSIQAIIGAIILIFAVNFSVVAQNEGNPPSVIDYKTTTNYTLGGLTVEGTEFYDPSVIRSITGLIVGQGIDIPGDDVSRAIRKLWQSNLFANISIVAEKFEGDKVFLVIKVTEKPRLLDIEFTGLKSGDKEDIEGKLESLKRRPITEGMLVSITNTIEDFYAEKGFLNPTIDIQEKKDSIQRNASILMVDVDKGIKVKISEISFIGHQEGELSKMRKAMKNTREKAHFHVLKPNPNNTDTRTKKEKASDIVYTAANLNIASIQNFFSSRTNPNIFKASKFNEDLYETDKRELIAYYNSIGYRDAKIVRDTFYYVDRNQANIKIEIHIEEGNQYRFRNISWKGNAKYSDETLAKILGIKKGDIYNSALLQQRLELDPSGADISSLYYDDGYLFFQITPKEIAVVEDSIDIEIRINEGPQATIKNVIIKGNDKTNEHVIRRELRTKPGEKFSRTDLIRSQREIANLGFFDAEQIGVVPIPTPADGTVDIEYTVVEKSADQSE
ncbi:MAG: POTRA domain-containing protein [Chitinophagales bacterium]